MDCCLLFRICSIIYLICLLLHLAEKFPDLPRNNIQKKLVFLSNPRENTKSVGWKCRPELSVAQVRTETCREWL